ncbi:GtrA family protein [Agrococcus jejuensis]|uniref:Putative flippase GtrA (Transmembrane translocase of bactoprenol-linked glucose) n=1 Tax=Agrococcus jejuensis TaxID=399736 RepID=A0A1G8EIZ1_9MICO|nr:GtrA family protein [Agrococcus jejuensis]SDH69913.1 Putative flippase GtrA (transmembrane translocase of bactoprenol-linked glucose) [Agrococcus jejuensis]
MAAAAGATPDAAGAVDPRSVRMRRLAIQFGKFLIVGGISFSVDYGLFLLLHTVLGVPYVAASTISFSLSLILNYVLTLKFVFVAQPGRSIAKEFAIYVGLNIVALGLNQLILFLSVELLHVWPEIGKLIATAIVLVYNFIARKMLIERPGRAAAPAADDRIDETRHQA